MCVSSCVSMFVFMCEYVCLCECVCVVCIGVLGVYMGSSRLRSNWAAPGTWRALCLSGCPARQPASLDPCQAPCTPWWAAWGRETCGNSINQFVYLIKRLVSIGSPPARVNSVHIIIIKYIHIYSTNQKFGHALLSTSVVPKLFTVSYPFRHLISSCVPPPPLEENTFFRWMA